MELAEVRTRAAAALAPQSDADPDVHVDYPDAVQPPAILVLWDNPWLDPTTFQGMAKRGQWEGRLRLLCLAWRNEPGPGITKLEELVAYVVGRMLADNVWPVASVQAPGGFNINGVPMLGANVTYSVPVTL